MTVSWIFLVLEAFLLVEVNLALMSSKKANHSLSKVISLQTMAETTLGSRGGILVGAVYVLLTYALIVAYISKSGEVLSLLFHVPRQIAEVLFVGVFGYLLLSGGTKLADRANQFMTAGLIGLFLLLVIGGSKYGDWAALLHQNWNTAPEAIPVIFLALVYHDLIPVICTYLDGDVRRIQTSVIVGSAIPLAMLLCWNAVALSLASTSGNADPLSLAIQTSFAVQLFSLLAVLTSIIGSVLGMSEFFIERLGKSIAILLPGETFFDDATSPRPAHIKLVSVALVLVPPLLLSLSISDAFFTAADLAGGYGMTTLYGVLPPVMAWGLAKESGNSQYPGGRNWITKRGTLAVTGVCACGIIAGQLILDLS
ncbi:uncharacterized protein LOC112343198 [Selaginella moellendorffii]|uniref:uncharacterized protein LOC112343198 n=1 Tax=Selaginella moellendorffii TaxID=88036 RepID=UPI000D1C4A2E|nr:uncharacterized protein LOC112343198 [Selaginella moellendorffii]|eukprot:XP_024522062.1 uncharacterized protein LOC112343198 [Selaginella moellendorffii]